MIDKAYVRIAEGQVHLRHQPAESDFAPLVLIHPSPASSRAMMPLIEALGEAREIFAFDTPCNGQSCSPDIAEPDVAHFAGMLQRAFVEASSADQVILYGCHTGAHIGIEWALAEPQRVKALVLDGVALWDKETQAEFLANYAPQKKPDQTGAQFHWAWNFLRDQMIFWPYYKRDEAHKRVGGTFDAQVLHNLTLDVLNNLETYHMPYHAVFRHDVKVSLAKLEVPVLVLTHAGAPLDETAEAVLDTIPQAHRTEMDGSDVGKAAAITAFLKEIDHG